MPYRSNFPSRPAGPAFWGRIHDPRLQAFYTSLAREQEPQGEDWQPMVALLDYVRTVEGSLHLFAFISSRRLHLTRAPRYVDSAGHHSVFIGWQPSQRHYRVGYSSLDHSLGAEAEEEILSPEEGVTAVLGQFLGKLLAV